MAASFKPLALVSPPSDPASTTSFRLKVLPKAPNGSVPAHTAACAAGTVTNGNGASPPAQPVITLKYSGDRVDRIQVRCPCGQTIELTCSY